MFGAFASVSLGSSCTFQHDDAAFLFSLKNKHARLVKFALKACSDVSNEFIIRYMMIVSELMFVVVDD